jgi:membrane-bound lytic murein transglycosylase A
MSLVACERRYDPPSVIRYSPVVFAALPGWNLDDQGAALAAFKQSCVKLQRLGRDDPAGIASISLKGGDWQQVCAAAGSVTTAKMDAARAFFENWFTPYAVTKGGSDQGLFTGYFEAGLRGSWVRRGHFTVPIYAPPKDLVTVALGRFDPALKGRRMQGKVEGRSLVPYDARAAIDRGALAGRGRPLMWVDDPVDAFFLHVQGSGRVAMTDGSIIRLGFAAHNGRGYVSIGRVLIDRGVLPEDCVSMQSIRAWMANNPTGAAALMAENPRYIFFQFLSGTGPLGAAGVPLTAGRSLAVDRAAVPLGVPVWLDTSNPIARDRPLRRLMVAQDTGGAIRGAIRGDVFWGFGQEAAQRAGRMQEKGRWFVLLPKTAVLQPGS